MGWFDGAFLTPNTYSYLLLIKGEKKKKKTFSSLKREKWHTSDCIHIHCMQSY